MMEPTTPTEPLSPHVRRLCRSISRKDHPVFLPLSDVDFAYATKQCHMNVLHRVRQAGGRRVSGWLIWECPSFAELQFHCVWQAPDGTLHDITPREDGEPVILFMPDRITRLRRTEKGFLQPANRQSSGHYTFQGLPHPGPMAECVLSESARAWAAKLGMAPWDVCDLA